MPESLHACELFSEIVLDPSKVRALGRGLSNRFAIDNARISTSIEVLARGLAIDATARDAIHDLLKYHGKFISTLRSMRHAEKAYLDASTGGYDIVTIPAEAEEPYNEYAYIVFSNTESRALGQALQHRIRTHITPLAFADIAAQHINSLSAHNAAIEIKSAMTNIEATARELEGVEQIAIVGSDLQIVSTPPNRVS